MNKPILISYYRKRGFDQETTCMAVDAVLRLEKEIVSPGNDLSNVLLDDIRKYMRRLTREKQIFLDSILAFARYFYLISRQDIYIFFTSLLGGLGVLQNIIKRAKLLVGEEIVSKILENFDIPQIGLEPVELQEYTKEFMLRLERNLPTGIVRQVLTGNNHEISKESFLKERELFLNAESIDAYLLDLHNRKVRELQDYCDQNKVWYEQIITQDVVDFVKDNQEILSAVRENDKLYVTKIPYNPASYLQEKDPKIKRYYACHCPLAREAILKEECGISSNWCYCSAGFEKFPFEVVLGQPLEAELLESVLTGGSVCRFSIKMPLL